MTILFCPIGMRFFAVSWRLLDNFSELKMSGLSQEYQYLSDTATQIIGTCPISTQFSVSRTNAEQSGYSTWIWWPESKYFVHPVRWQAHDDGSGGSRPDVSHFILSNTGSISLLAKSFVCWIISGFNSFGRLILRGSRSTEGSTLIFSLFNSSRACFTLFRNLHSLN